MAGLPWARMTQYHACTKSQGPNNKISKDEWLICIENSGEEITKKHRIERVPSMLRGIESNSKCYDPLVVSIGPYHHGKPGLEEVEELKFLYAKQFQRDCDNNVSMDELYEEVAKVSNEARECYEEGSTKEHDEESFTRMMFLDACFVLQFMCNFTNAESNNPNKTDTEPKEVDPRLKMKSYPIAFVLRDLFLLENQIPSRVLEALLNFRSKEKDSLIENFLKRATIMPPEETSCTNKVKKFVNICTNEVTNRFKSNRTKGNEELPSDSRPHLLDRKQKQLGGPHLLDLKQKQLGGPHLLDLKQKELGGTSNHEGKEEPNQWDSYRSVTELEAAGIHFKASKTHHVTDVKFKDWLLFGTMTLPPLMVDDTTKSLLLNLVAYEMSLDDPSGSHITSYICLMDSLIDQPNDVKELRRKGILLNKLGSDEQLATLFNQIADYLVSDPRAYANVKSEIQKYWKSKARVWIAEWIYNHFSSPWTIFAFLAATSALALTMAQTYFSVFPRSK